MTLLNTFAHDFQYLQLLVFVKMTKIRRFHIVHITMPIVMWPWQRNEVYNAICINYTFICSSLNNNHH